MARIAVEKFVIAIGKLLYLIGQRPIACLEARRRTVIHRSVGAPRARIFQRFGGRPIQSPGRDVPL